MPKSLRFSDLYRNITRYMKYHKCKDDFEGTRQYLDSLIDDPGKVDIVITKIQLVGAVCDCEILNKVKPLINGRILLTVLD